MDWYEDVLDCVSKGNEIWFRRTNEIILELSDAICNKSHKAIVLWALSMANDVRNKLSHSTYMDTRPRVAIEYSTDWAFGRCSMKNAKNAIILCHAMCKEGLGEVDKLYCHAIGQACSTVHTPKHAMGLPVYELTAIARVYGVENCKEAIISRKEFYIERMKFCENEADKYADWANFMMN